VNLPTLPAQHLSDEAVAAFADGALSATARARAARHVADCAECAGAIAVQREAVLALRAATAPSLPGGLLDRLRAVPSTTSLNQRPIAVDPEGSAVFPAFGTAAAYAPEAELPAPPAPPAPAPMAAERRHRPYGLLTAAAAVVALGAAGVALAGSGDSRPATPVTPAPGAPAQVRPAVFDPNLGVFFGPVPSPPIAAVREQR
jgi:hypothetical protein